MPVDYANGPREPASRFRIPRSSKIPKSIFSRLKSGLVDLLPHITGARREKKRSLFSQQQRTVEDSNMLRSNKDIVCVCGTACQLSLLSLHTLAEPGLLNRELCSLHTDHILHGEWQSPPAALEGDPRTANICCGSRRTRGLQTAHLHF